MISNFEFRARMLINRNIPTFPIPAKTKKARLSNWQELATADLAKVMAFNPGPDDNTAAVAKAQPGGFCFFDVDAPNYHKTIQEQTGQKFPDTFLVSSRPGQGRGHFYFKHTRASIALHNSIGKDFISGKDAEGKEAWSFRINNSYVIGPLSIHPNGGTYTVQNADTPIVDCPDWLVQWVAANSAEEQKAEVVQPTTTVTEGGRNNFLASKLGAIHQAGVVMPELLAVAEKLNQEHCSPPLSANEVQTIAKSINTYEIKPGGAGSVTLGGKLPGTVAVAAARQEVEAPKIELIPYPQFPTWAFKGCNMYDGYIKELCDKNCRYSEMMLVPGFAILLNYLGTRVRMNGTGRVNGAFVNIIGRKGKVIKSSSVNDMFAYYQLANILETNSHALRNAEGKSVVWNAGSTEGLGLDASRINCRNMIMFFDELKTMADKASIEGSSMGGHALTMLQSGKFGNTVKNLKGSFSFDTHTYTASIIACCTDRKFSHYWGRMIAVSEGLEDRATLVFQPEHFKDFSTRVYVSPSTEVIAREKELIHKALAQNNYELEEFEMLQHFGEKYGVRSEVRAEEWALAFAVQMGLESVTSGCVERGIALETYNRQVKKYLNVREAETREAQIQNQIVQILMQSGGSVGIRELNKKMRPDRFGSGLWFQVYSGLIRSGQTAQTGAGVQGDPKRLVLLQIPENEDE